MMDDPYYELNFPDYDLPAIFAPPMNIGEMNRLVNNLYRKMELQAAPFRDTVLESEVAWCDDTELE
jgi:hypothetical protein